MKKCLLLLTMLIGLTGFTPHNADHENWTYLGFNSEYNAEIFADLSNITANAEEKGVWVKTERYEEYADEGITYYIEKGFFWINCYEKTIRIKNLNWYDAKEKYVAGTDELIANTGQDEWEMEPRELSDNFDLAIYQAVCGK